MMYQNQNQNQSNFNLLDILNIFIIFLQFRTQLKLDKQATNNDLLKELNKDVDLILERLDRIETRRKTNE